jgi:hypothetical protein
MSTKVDENNPAEFLMEMAKAQGGVACATVKDGHVLVFSKQALLGLLEQCEARNSDKVVVFVKRQDMANAS